MVTIVFECLTVCYYHVAYAFQREFTLYSCLNVKGPPCSKQARYLKFRDSNGIRIHNHLVCKRTLNYIAKLTKWFGCVVSFYMYGAFDCMLLSCHINLQSESTLYSCLKKDQIKAQIKADITAQSFRQFG